MGEIVNLRAARKRRVRADDARRADANRTIHGVPRAERHAAAVEAKRAERDLDGARLAAADQADGSDVPSDA